MANTITFDTHALIKRLKDSGFEESQAEALSETLKESQEAHFEELATKQDLKELEYKIKELEQKMDIKLESIKGEIRLLKWMMGILLAGVLSLVMKAFFI